MDGGQGAARPLAQRSVRAQQRAIQIAGDDLRKHARHAVRTPVASAAHGATTPRRTLPWLLQAPSVRDFTRLLAGAPAPLGAHRRGAAHPDRDLARRPYPLHSGQFWSDEAIATGVASHSLSAIPGILRDAGSTPLYYFLLHVWIGVFGPGEAATHVLSLLLGLLAIPLAMWAGWSLFGRRAGISPRPCSPSAPS